MKLFTTERLELPLQQCIYILKEGDKTSIVQLDNRGKYISVVDSFDIPDGNYAIDKKQFFNTLKELKKEFEVRVTKKEMIFTKDTAVIALPLMEFDLSSNMPKDYKLKDLPENFWRLFDKAAKIAGDMSKEKTNPILNGVHIHEDKIYSASQGGVFRGNLSTKTDIDMILNSDILKVVKNPLKYAVDGTNLVLTSNEGTAVLRTMEGTAPDLERLFKDEPTEGNIIGDNGFKDLDNAIRSVKDMGFNAIELTTSCEALGTMINIADRDGKPKFKKDINVTLVHPAKFAIGTLLSGLVGDKIYCEGGVTHMYIYGTESQTVILPLRN